MDHDSGCTRCKSKWPECHCAYFTADGYWGLHSNLLNTTNTIDESCSLARTFYNGMIYFGTTPRNPETRNLLHLAPIPSSVPSLVQLCIAAIVPLIKENKYPKETLRPALPAELQDRINKAAAPGAPPVLEPEFRWKDETRSEDRWITQVMIDTYVPQGKGNRIISNLHLKPVDEQASKTKAAQVIHADLVYGAERYPYNDAVVVMDRICVLLNSGPNPPRWYEGCASLNALFTYGVCAISDEYVFILDVGDNY